MKEKNTAGRFDSIALFLDNDPNLIRLIVIATLVFITMSLLNPGKFLTALNIESMASQFPELGILAMGHDERRYAIVTEEHERIVESVRRRLRRASREAMVAHLDVTEQRLMARVVDMQMDGAGRSS